MDYQDMYYELLDDYEELDRECCYLREEVLALEKCLDELPDDIYNEHIAGITESN